MDDIRIQLSFLSRQYSNFVVNQTNLKLQLTNMVDKTFPGIKKAIDDENRYNLFLDIYEKYSYPENVLKLSEKEFINDIESTHFHDENCPIHGKKIVQTQK